MEIKDRLVKPYQDMDRFDFIVRNNHIAGYEIKETDEALEAWGLTAEEQAEKELENKKASVRAVREQYFADYVDFYQSKPLLWEDMEEEWKDDIADYRRYLKDYTQTEGWWEKFPLDFISWKEH